MVATSVGVALAPLRRQRGRGPLAVRLPDERVEARRVVGAPLDGLELALDARHDGHEQHADLTVAVAAVGLPAARQYGRRAVPPLHAADVRAHRAAQAARVHGVVERVGRWADAARRVALDDRRAVHVAAEEQRAGVVGPVRVVPQRLRDALGARMERVGVLPQLAVDEVAAESVALRLPDEHPGEPRQRVPGPVGAPPARLPKPPTTKRGPLMPSANPKCSTGSLSGPRKRSCRPLLRDHRRAVAEPRRHVGQTAGRRADVRGQAQRARSRRHRCGRTSSNASSSGSPSRSRRPRMPAANAGIVGRLPAELLVAARATGRCRRTGYVSTRPVARGTPRPPRGARPPSSCRAAVLSQRLPDACHVAELQEQHVEVVARVRAA